MTVKKISSTTRHTGLSTDTKPAASAGSKFFETDTQKRYISFGGSNWALEGGSPISEEGNAIVQFGDSPSIDAFGRARFTEPETLIDSKLLWDKAPLFWDEAITDTSGNATSVHSAANARVRMHAAAGDTIIRQTFMRFNYQPGKSQLAFFTGVINVTGSNFTDVDCRWGLYDGTDGIYFQHDDGVAYIVQEKAGTPTRVAQSAWNLDKLDGTGRSGVTIDFEADNIYVIDFEWLGTGRVRYGIFLHGHIIYIHQTLNGNVRDSVYISTPNLPIRYSVESAISTGADVDFDQICSTVISEGETHDHGTIKWVSTSGAGVVTGTENLLFAVVGLRLKSTHLDAVVKLISAAIQIHTASEFLEWVLVFNGTVAGTFTYADVADSPLQRALGVTANTVTGGVLVSGSYLETGNQGGASDYAIVESARRLGAAIDGTPDEVVLCVRPIGGVSALTCEGGIGFRELL